MPTRMLKESICTSESIDKLSWFAEVLFYRLIVNCDDFGRFDGREAIIKGMLFPLKTVTTKQIKDGIKNLSTAGMLLRYVVDGKPYLQMLSWDKHQKRRADKSKYPEPSENDKSELLQTNACNCEQVQTNVPVFDSRYSIVDSRILAESSEADSRPVISIILNDGTYYDVKQVDVEGWAKLYPAVDVMQELRKMAGWCEAATKRRKTRSGFKTFVVNWLSKQQDKGGGKTGNENEFSEFDDMLSVRG